MIVCYWKNNAGWGRDLEMWKLLDLYLNSLCEFYMFWGEWSNKDFLRNKGHIELTS